MSWKIPKDPNTQIPERWTSRLPRQSAVGYLGLWVIGCFALTGCGDSHPDTVDVTGEVFHNGQPVDGANVVFTSDGPIATGITDAQGKFTLRTFRDGDGAIAGMHRVTITKNISAPSTPEDPYPTVKNMLPAQYARPDSSGLTADVSAEKENVFRFDLVD